MKFRMSSAIAVQTDDAEAARRFYGEVIGFTEKDGGFDAAPLTLYVDAPKKCDGALLELIVDDLDAARAHLEGHGCTVVRWEGRGRTCLVRDPFGVHYNLWQND